MDVAKIKKRKYPVQNKKVLIDIPKDKWDKCPSCKEIIYKMELEDNLDICPYCGYYFRMSTYKRIKLITDDNTFLEFDFKIKTTNPLKLDNYLPKLKALQEETSLEEAVTCGQAKIDGEDVILCVMDSNFFMGSMGSVVGEKITRSIEIATLKKLPLVIFCASGGARMQEGIISLMQMAKTTEALSKHDKAGLLYISVLTDPTYGGVTASFASLGDIIIAEPHAMIGFTGPKVIKETINESLPEGFQTSEFLLEHGFIDIIVERDHLKEMISKLISYHKGEKHEKKK